MKDSFFNEEDNEIDSIDPKTFCQFIRLNQEEESCFNCNNFTQMIPENSTISQPNQENESSTSPVYFHQLTAENFAISQLNQEEENNFSSLYFSQLIPENFTISQPNQENESSLSPICYIQLTTENLAITEPNQEDESSVFFTQSIPEDFAISEPNQEDDSRLSSVFFTQSIPENSTISESNQEDETCLSPKWFTQLTPKNITISQPNQEEKNILSSQSTPQYLSFPEPKQEDDINKMVSIDLLTQLIPENSSILYEKTNKITDLSINISTEETKDSSRQNTIPQNNEKHTTKKRNNRDDNKRRNIQVNFDKWIINYLNDQLKLQNKKEFKHLFPENLTNKKKVILRLNKSLKNLLLTIPMNNKYKQQNDDKYFKTVEKKIYSFQNCDHLFEKKIYDYYKDYLISDSGLKTYLENNKDDSSHIKEIAKNYLNYYFDTK